MSTASAIPPLLPASISDCIIAPASMNWRKLCTGGKPGRSTAPPAPPVWIASSRVGKTMIGAISCGRRKVCRIERMPSARTTRRLVAMRSRGHSLLAAALLALVLEVVTGLGDEYVIEAGVDELQRADRDAGLVEGPHHARDVAGSVLDLDQDRPAVDRRQQRADPGADLLRRGDRSLLELQADVGVADFGFERRRGALGGAQSRNRPPPHPP